MILDVDRMDGSIEMMPSIRIATDAVPPEVYPQGLAVTAGSWIDHYFPASRSAQG